MIKKYLSWKIIVFGFCVLVLANCKIPYDPPVKSNQTNFLVVEGFIDGGAPTVMKISRTRIVSAGDTAKKNNELFASVFVEDDQGNSFRLQETGNGIYTSVNTLNLIPANKYHLRIVTANSKEYVSDAVPFKPSPEIDKIGWKLKDGGVQVFINTHDQNDATKYYRWEYKETWEFHSSYNSGLIYVPANNTVVTRTEQVFQCWRSNYSSSILLGSSAKLSHDVIEQAPLVYIEEHSQKLSVLYSILVKQYALDINAYNYWEAMRNNTEKVGSIFDPQPNQTVGNIHCTTDASEIVVGYIGAGGTLEKRFYIKNSELPANWNSYGMCETKDVTQDSIAIYFNGGYAPISQSMDPSGIVYNSSYVECVDCTLQGTNIKPDFWP